MNQQGKAEFRSRSKDYSRDFAARPTLHLNGSRRTTSGQPSKPSTTSKPPRAQGALKGSDKLLKRYKQERVLVGFEKTNEGESVSGYIKDFDKYTIVIVADVGQNQWAVVVLYKHSIAAFAPVVASVEDPFTLLND